MLTKALLDVQQDDITYTQLISPNAPVPPQLATRSAIQTLPLPPKSILRKNGGDLEGLYSRFDGTADALLLCSPFEGYLSNETTSPSGEVRWAKTTVPLVYDLIPLRFPELYFARNPHYERWYFKKVETLLRAERLLAISNATRDDLSELLCISADKVTVIGAGVDDRFSVEDSPNNHIVDSRYIGLGDYFITVYQEDHRKNPELLLRAFARLPFAIRLNTKIVVVTNNDRHSAKLREFAIRLGIPESSVVVTGYVSDDELTYLYAHALAMVFPSLYEGFGLPALESIFCGTVALVSDQSSLPEVVGTKETLFNPYDEIALLKLLRRSYDDRQWAKELWKQQFTHAQRYRWSKIAERTHLALAGLCDQTTDIGTHMRRSLYVTSPVAPTKSGIATYMTNWGRALAQDYDLCFVTQEDPNEVTDPFIASHAVKAESLAGCFQPWRRFIHHIGNQPHYHSYQLELLESYGGIVVLHDVVLDHFSDFIESDRVLVPQTLKNLFKALPKLRSTMSISEITTLRDLRVNALLRWITDRCDKVVVHSEHARTLLLTRTGMNSDKVDVSVHGQSLKQRFRHIHKVNETEIRPLTLASPGFIDLSKSPFSVLHGASLLPGHLRPKVDFIGTGDEDLINSLYASASILEVQISVSGYLEDSAFLDRLQQADVGIVLRSHDRGETSGAALLCLALGIPLIVEACGSFAELPESCCIKIADMNPKSLAHAINQLTLDPAFLAKLSRSALEFVQQDLSWNRVIKDIARYIKTGANDIVLVDKR
jgi:glycosyltransferase involved in cell wall biosynthesis